MYLMIQGINLPYIDGTILNSTGNLYFDSIFLDPYLQAQRNQYHEVSFTIVGKETSNCINNRVDNMIIAIQDPYCNDIIITGTLMNVTDKAEIQMVHEGYTDSFFDFILSNDQEMSFEFDLDFIYKMVISNIKLTHASTKQSISVNINEYYNVDDDDIFEYISRYDIDIDDYVDDDVQTVIFSDYSYKDEDSMEQQWEY